MMAKPSHSCSPGQGRLLPIAQVHYSAAAMRRSAIMHRVADLCSLQLAVLQLILKQAHSQPALNTSLANDVRRII
jgi:hypothetical protein